MTDRDGYTPVFIICSRKTAQLLGALDPEHADIDTTQILILPRELDGTAKGNSMLWATDPLLHAEAPESNG
jgi:hypothetical protein